MPRRTLFTDPFPQANESPLSSGGVWAGGYTGDVSFQVVNHQVQCISSSVETTMTRNNTRPNNQWMKIQYAALGTGYTELDMLVRFAAPPTVSGYMGGIWRDGAGVHAQIVKVTNGTQVRIGGPVNVTLVGNDPFWFEASGTTLTLYQDVTQLIQVTGEATFGSGLAGLLAYTQDAVANTAIFNFASGDFVTPVLVDGAAWRGAWRGMHRGA